jgi:ubiquinone biosynthesis protein UbiJ
MNMVYGLPMAIMDVEEEVKMLEEYKEALTKRLEKVNKRLEALKR